MNQPTYRLNLTTEQFDILEEAASLLVLKHQFIRSMEEAVERLAGIFVISNGGLLPPPELQEDDDGQYSAPFKE